MLPDGLLVRPDTRGKARRRAWRRSARHRARKPLPTERILHLESLEERRLLTVTILEEQFKEMAFQAEGSFSGQTRLPVNGLPDYVDNYAGDIDWTGSMVYTSPVLGSGTAGGTGSGSGADNYHPGPGDLDNYSFTLTGSGSADEVNGVLVNVAGGAIVRFDGGGAVNRVLPSGAQVNSTVDVSQIPFLASLSWSFDVEDQGRTGQSTGGWNGTVTPSDPHPFDIGIGDVKWLDRGVEFEFEVTGKPTTTDNRAVAVTGIEVYYARSEQPSSVIGDAVDDAVPVYWNQAGGKATVTELGEVPQDAKYLLVIADPDQDVVEGDESNNVAAIGIPDLDIVSYDVTFPIGNLESMFWNMISGLNSPIAFELEATVEIRNNGMGASPEYDLVLFASETQSFDPNAATYLDLKQVSQPVLDAGETVTVPLSGLPNPVASPEIQGAPRFQNGYFYGTIADPTSSDPLGSVVETEETNNDAYQDACSSETGILLALRTLADLFVYLTPSLAPNAAQQHLHHYLDAVGTPVHWGSDSDVAGSIAGSSQFQSGIQQGIERFVEDRIRQKSFAGQAQGTLAEAVPDTIFAANPLFFGLSNPGQLDVAFAFGGFQGYAGNYQLDYETVVDGNQAFASYMGQVSVNLSDRYEFDLSDIGKSPFDFLARHAEMCGVAAPFDSSVSILVPIQGTIPLGPANSLQDLTGFTADPGVEVTSSFLLPQRQDDPATRVVWQQVFDQRLQTVQVDWSGRSSQADPTSGIHRFEVVVQTPQGEELLESRDLADLAYAPGSGGALLESERQVLAASLGDANLQEGVDYVLEFRLVSDQGQAGEQVAVVMDRLLTVEDLPRLFLESEHGSVSDGSLDFGVDSGGTTQATLLAENRGQAPLTLDSLTLAGTGFVLDQPSQLPVIVPPGQSTEIVISLVDPLADEMASLSIGSDDPADGTVEVPVVHRVNVAPEITPRDPDRITSSTRQLVFRAEAGDANVPAQELAFRKTSGTDRVQVHDTGIVVWNADPNRSDSYADAFELIVRDNGTSPLDSDPLTFVVVVNGPVAVDDQVAVVPEGTVRIPVLANDEDPDGSLDVTSVNVTTMPEHGTVDVDGSTGEVVYTPKSGFKGEDSLTYEVDDNAGLTSNEAFVHILVGSWQNPDNPLDVNGIEGTTPLDALIVINHINAHPGDPSVPKPPATPPPFMDVNGDFLITAIDVLWIVNFLNSRGEGMGVSPNGYGAVAAARFDLSADAAAGSYSDRLHERDFSWKPRLEPHDANPWMGMDFLEGDADFDDEGWDRLEILGWRGHGGEREPLDADRLLDELAVFRADPLLDVLLI